jgi:hypothetical protein
MQLTYISTALRQGQDMKTIAETLGVSEGRLVGSNQTITA